MADPLEKFPPLPTNPEPIDTATTTSNIPISDFRRNEARPILTDDGELISEDEEEILH